MASTRISELLRRMKDSAATLLLGLSIFLPHGSANAAKTPPEKLTISQRVTIVREQLRQSTGVQVNQTNPDEQLSQWPNWPNWPNMWPNWNNWNNFWPNWRNF